MINNSDIDRKKSDKPRSGCSIEHIVARTQSLAKEPSTSEISRYSSLDCLAFVK